MPTLTPMDTLLKMYVRCMIDLQRDPQNPEKWYLKCFFSAFILTSISQHATHFYYGHLDASTIYLGQTVITHRQF